MRLLSGRGGRVFSSSGLESSQAALLTLLKGNHRFVNGRAEYPNQSPERRAEIVGGQNPFAIILTCSDSRLPPEVLFDQGLGDLFVIRTAGNIVDDIALGSIEYAVEHLKVSLLIVLGHQKCGAVTAAVEGGEAPGHIANVVEKITPAVEAARSMPGDLTANAINVNVYNFVNFLKASEPFLSKAVHEARLEIAGARYDLDSGVVTLL